MVVNRSERGFSLIELITVVVVLAVVATIGTGFIVSATESYRQTQARALLVNTGRQAVHDPPNPRGTALQREGDQLR